jgi:hypothetical protein
MQVLMTASKQSQDGTVIKTCMNLTNAKCTVEKLLMMGKEVARNMSSFMTE